MEAKRAFILYNNQKKIVETFGAHNEEKGFGKLDTQKMYSRQEGNYK